VNNDLQKVLADSITSIPGSDSSQNAQHIEWCQS